MTEAISVLKSGIPTRNGAFNAMIDRIERVAMHARAPVLLGPRIFGLKRAGRRPNGGFVKVNCATLHGDHTVSALSGHVRGAFIGAHSDRAGLLCAAYGGGLFLDEIGKLGLEEQR